MALKVKAQEKLQKIGTYAGKYRYIMMPELYTSLSQDKVIKEAALRSGVSKGIMQACWDAPRALRRFTRLRQASLPVVESSSPQR